MDGQEQRLLGRRAVLLRAAALVGAAVALAACQHTALYTRSKDEDLYKNRSRPAPSGTGGT